MPCRTVVYSTLVATAFTTLLGCDGGARPNELVAVSGEVTFDGEPLHFGSVAFQPLQGGQPARGEIGADGRFVLTTNKSGDGAAVGRHRVKIVCYSQQDPALKDKAGGDSLGDSLIPERYTSFTRSGIEVSVLAQGNAPFVFNLEPDPAASVAGETEAVADAEANANKKPADADGAAPANGEQSVE